MLVYQTESFRQRVEELGLTERVDHLCDAIQEANGLGGVRQLLQPLVPYYKERMEKKRLIGRVHRVDDQNVFCWLNAFERKSDDYNSFLWNRRESGERLCDSHLDQNKLRAWVKEQERLGGVDPNSSVPRMPDELEPWLNPPWQVASGLLGGEDVEIYESRTWVTKILRSDFRSYRLRFGELVAEAASAEPGQHASADVEWIEVLRASQGRGAIVFLRPTGRPSDVFLVEPVLDSGVLDVRAAVESLGLGNRPPSTEQVARYARRAYPGYLTLDEDAWASIQADESANLALSGEEQQLLTSVAFSSEGGGLPLFINGRAGSGKSTMLMYLFAAYAAQKVEAELPGRPIYLTYNERLLDAARKGVRSLLSAGFQNVAGVNLLNEIDLGSWFESFHDFLLDQLPPEAVGRFVSDHRVTFHHFKRAYSGGQGRLQPLMLPEARKWSPELCWYVLRTFVKGYAASGILECDAYEELPRAEQTVPYEVFRQIYESIWERWYKQALLDGGLWDDQDLVAAVLARDLRADGQQHEPITAIVCDEAQDFTRRELMILARSSVLANFDLGQRHLGGLPFALAGDPLQTLNPTGFSWSSVQAGLYDELASQTGNTSLDVRLETLENNYRSTAQIVQVVNLIQLWRRVLFDLRDLKPQIPWDPVGGPTPLKFILGTNLDAEDFGRLIEDTIVIVPAEEGGELDFVRSDDVLSALYPEASATNPPRNVLTPSSSKGSEFGRIVLYKFGGESPNGMFDPEAELQFEHEYFLNKLYVAATRAQNHLIIVDTSDGDERLWSRAIPSEREAMLARVDSSSWAELTAPLELSDPNSSAELRDEDLEDTARKLLDNAIAAENATLARQAAGYYTRLNDETQAAISHAWALRFDEELATAGQAFLETEAWTPAWECFWEAKAWTGLAEWFDEAPPVEAARRDREQSLVEFMSSPRSVDAVADLGRALLALAESDRIGSPLSAPWREALAAFVDAAAGSQGEVTSEDSIVVAQALEVVAQHRFEGASAVAGHLYYSCGRMDDAVRCWDEAGEVGHLAYGIAQCEVMGTPAGLKHLARSFDRSATGEIIQRWDSEGSPADPEWLEWVAPALQQSGDYERAFDAFLSMGDGQRAADIVQHLVGDHADLVRRRAPEVGRLLGKARDLPRLKNYINGGNIKGEVALAMRSRSIETIVLDARDHGWEPNLTASQRDRLKDQLAEVTRHRNWTRQLSPQIAGAAYEVAGFYNDTLKFYEKFVESDDRALQKYARERWLSVKSDQLGFLERGGRSKQAEVERRRRANKAHDWGYREDQDLDRWPAVDSLAIPTPELQAEIVTGRAAQRWNDIQAWREGSEVTLLDRKSMLGARLDMEIGRIYLSSTEELDLRADTEFRLGDHNVVVLDPALPTFRISTADGQEIGVLKVPST